VQADFPSNSNSPVKIFLHVFPSIAPWHVASIAIALMVYVFISEMKNLLYFSVKVFFHSIISIFFRSVEVVGRDNIPRYGPVIFVGNHANQFVDGIMMLSTCEHKISYLMAEASWNRRVIGDIAWALDVVPVKRAQDYCNKGTGKISMTPLDTIQKNTEIQAGDVVRVTGSETVFTKEIKVGDKIRPPGTSVAMKVLNIESDTVLKVDASDAAAIGDVPTESVAFDVLPKIDHKVVFSRVLEKLASGGAVGIFPEGGSHDRTDLLPLKVGVALIAYSALEKDGINVPIVPVGLNYFQRKKFRGRAVVEYGRPIFIDPTTLKAYEDGGSEKRRVCNELLARIEDSMKSVIVTTPDYETNQLIHTARRLWQQKELQASAKQDLTRRFAEGYKQLLLHCKGEPPQEWKDLHSRVIMYQNELNELGIRDYQVPGLEGEIKSVDDLDGDRVLREIRLPYQIGHIVILMLLAGIPAVFLNLPVGLIARLYAERRRKKALANSKVKITAEDVLMTEKILICIVLVPTFWIMYAVLLCVFTDMDSQSIALAFFCMPLFSYMSIMWAEAGMVETKDLKPYVKRLFPSSRRRISVLPETRMKLQHDLRAFIRKHKAIFGEIYYGEDLDWSVIQSKTRLSKELKDE
jgi:glycerol-3-phosphate O-acyltransferase / dihydroxyacetone phosphate acyltransferase